MSSLKFIAAEGQMLCVGFSGGLNLIHENPFEQEFGHDGAAVLVEDGEVIAAIEEERLNRIKHSDKFPVNALRFCLNRRGIKPHTSIVSRFMPPNNIATIF